MPDQALFGFLGPLAHREGAWVIEPQPGVMTDGILSRLREVPARIIAPGGQPRDRFAERGRRGKWLIIWVPDE